MAGWRAGRLRRARWCPSPNFGPRAAAQTIDLVVVHSISLPPGVYGGDAVERLFRNELDFDEHPAYDEIRGLTVSAHFLIRRDGALVQFVSCDDRAWHAGRSTWRGRPECNDYSIGIELEGLAGGAFDEPQYEALARLVGELGRRYPIRDVAGHEHVAPGRKDDPGAAFDWHRLRRRIADPALRLPP